MTDDSANKESVLSSARPSPPARLGDAPRAELVELVEEFCGWWHLNREGSVNRTYDYIDKLVKQLRAAAGVSGAPDSYQVKQDALHLILPSIPQGTDWHANRYDTDNSMVLILWRTTGTNGEGETLQYDCAKILPAGVGGAPEEKK